jgi:hypothetical protein
MKRLLYIVLFAVALVACSQVPESSFDLPPNPPAPGGEQLYGRAIGDVGTVPSWASLIKYTTINKDLLRTNDKLIITTEKPAFYQGSQAQFVIYDKAYFYNAQSKTWTQIQASNTLSGQTAAANTPWKLDKGVFELTMDARLADGKNFFLVYYCGRATSNGTWDCEGNKWKIGAFEYRPLRVNCGDGYIDPDEECERDSDCSSGEVCTSSCMCMTPQEQRAALLESQMVADNKNIGILLPSPIIVGEEDDAFIGIKNNAINPTGSEVCFRTQIKCIGAPSGKYCDPSAQQNNIVVGGYSNIDSSQQVTSPWFAEVEDLDVPNNELAVFLGSLETPSDLAQGVYQMRLSVFKHKDNKACGASGFGTATQTEYALLDFNMNVTEPTPVCGDNVCHSTESSCGAQCTGTTCSACASTYCPEDCNVKETIWNSTGACSTVSGTQIQLCPSRTCDSTVAQGEYCNNIDESKVCAVAQTSTTNTTTNATGTSSNLTFVNASAQTGISSGSAVQQLNVRQTFTCMEKPAAPPQCGNNDKETGEECDGTDGVPANGSCSASCQIVCDTGFQKQGDQCVVPVVKNLRWAAYDYCSYPACTNSICAKQCSTLSGSISMTSLGSQCTTESNETALSWWSSGSQSGSFATNTVVTARCEDLPTPTDYKWNSFGECSSTCTGNEATPCILCPSQTCSASTNIGDACTTTTPCFKTVSNKKLILFCTPPRPAVIDLTWVPEGVCSDPSCTGQLCAATCPANDIQQSDLGTVCQTKGEAARVILTGQSGKGDTFVSAKCGNVSYVPTYTWQTQVECSKTLIGSSGGVACPATICGHQDGAACSVNELDDVCYKQRGSTAIYDIMACKPTSGVQFAQPSFPVTQVPAITGAVSFNDVANSKATQFAIVLIASLGIFIITLLNIVHKEK